MSYLEIGKSRFGSGDPYKWSIDLLDRIEKLESTLIQIVMLKKAKEVKDEVKPKMSVAERMAKARMARKRK